MGFEIPFENPERWECTLTPIEVDEAQLFQQVERELLEVGVRHFVERQAMLGWFHAWNATGVADLRSRNLEE